MKSKVLLFLTGVLFALQAVPAEIRYESKGLGLRFQVPQEFLLGQPWELPGAAKERARRGPKDPPSVEESLIERRFAAGQDLKDLSRGLPQISLSRHRGSDADFDRKFLMKDPFRQRIGPWEVYVLPGAPGPYGDKAFYDLVVLKDQSILQIFAPRFSDEEGKKPSYYDRVIRRLIESLEVIE